MGPENQTIVKQTSYFDKFCVLCYRFCYYLLRVTGSMAVITSILFYYEGEKYGGLGGRAVLLLLILCCISTFTTIFALCGLLRGVAGCRIIITLTKENIIGEKKNSICRFCYKWCSRLLTAIGAYCVILTPLCILCVVGADQIMFNEAPSFPWNFISWSFEYSLRFIYYFCLLVAIPVLFTAILKLTDHK